MFENQAAVISIGFEPTRLIFLGSSEGQMIAVSFLQQSSYMYLEMGMKKYCTVKVNRKSNEAGPHSARGASKQLFDFKSVFSH